MQRGVKIITRVGCTPENPIKHTLDPWENSSIIKGSKIQSVRRCNGLIICLRGILKSAIILLSPIIKIAGIGKQP